jgi:tetratricopeptide (TPR) repeat protein
MRHLFLLILLFNQTALANPPSFWAELGSTKGEGRLALQEAQYAYRSERFDEALEQAKVAREKAPSVEADYIYGLSLIHSRIRVNAVHPICAEALTLLQHVQERSAMLGDDPEIHLAIGLCAAVIGEYGLAIEENSLLAYHPNTKPVMSFLGFMNLGDSLMAVGDLDGAIDAYLEAYRRGPSEPYVSFALAVAYYRNCETKAAATAIRRALAMDPYHQTLKDNNIIFVPEEDKFFFWAVATAGNGETGAAHSYLGEYLSRAPEGQYRSRAMEAFWDVEAFSKKLTGETTSLFFQVAPSSKLPAPSKSVVPKSNSSMP